MVAGVVEGVVVVVDVGIVVLGVVEVVVVVVVVVGDGLLVEVDDVDDVDVD